MVTLAGFLAQGYRDPPSNLCIPDCQVSAFRTQWSETNWGQRSATRWLTAFYPGLKWNLSRGKNKPLSHITFIEFDLRYAQFLFFGQQTGIRWRDSSKDPVCDRLHVILRIFWALGMCLRTSVRSTDWSRFSRFERISSWSTGES